MTAGTSGSRLCIYTPVVVINGGCEMFILFWLFLKPEAIAAGRAMLPGRT